MKKDFSEFYCYQIFDASMESKFLVIRELLGKIRVPASIQNNPDKMLKLARARFPRLPHNAGLSISEKRLKKAVKPLYLEIMESKSILNGRKSSGNA